jgi:hypothetical protein
MKVRGFAVFCMMLVACMVTGVAALSKDKEKSLYGDEQPLVAIGGKPKIGLHGVAPYRSAFALSENKGIVCWRGSSGYFHQNKVTYARPLKLNTPFGNNIPGTEYKNDDADPMSVYSPQMFWVSAKPLNGPFYVVAWKDKDDVWQGFTEDAVGGDLAH